MSVVRSSVARILRLQQQHATRPPGLPRPLFYRQFHASQRSHIVKPFLLADIGEGITECQLIQWFVQPGARVEQFDKLCEVQSDKASVEITSPFDGVIKKLHYEPDDMAITGKALVDIDIQGELSEADEAKLGGGEGEGSSSTDTKAGTSADAEDAVKEQEQEAEASQQESVPESRTNGKPEYTSRPSKGNMGALATPAVRHLTKEFKVDIADIEGTGKDGRVLKEDVHKFVFERDETPQQATTTTTTASTKEDRKVALTPVQNQMFKTMTRSLSIPHFLYTCSADMTAVTTMRKRIKKTSDQKITHLAFIMKALSLSLLKHPLLNASLDTKDPKKPVLTYKGKHNFGIAVDTPAGLVVPVVHNVQDLSISAIAARMKELGEAAKNNKLSPGDFKGATFTVSNIGSVGGGVVSPVISEPQVAILGVGRSKVVPAFNEHDELVKKEELVLSWSADHRVVDGAECARCAEQVRMLLEDPGAMMLEMR
ncbi:branched-chain alpha-keto acid dehydrogenase E2 component like protein [Zymoseptoria brevis]|uniref:Dihydrolipoamide acetyltransferase component of pyruvate dehydrogenase complex n=1 Tax=Zymoseptoria brevis TaxID=1047168 RepID=A0A0F4GD15_9PEZI|nr:branched-chain alpha-keto acid dehydrogenase E2 component like protein [Zymoseptoria brevis]